MLKRRYLAFQERKGEFKKYFDEIESLKDALRVKNPDYFKLKGIIQAYENKLRIRRLELLSNGLLEDGVKKETASERKTIRNMKLALGYKEPFINFFDTVEGVFIIPRAYKDYDNAIDQTVEGNSIEIISKINLKPFQVKPVKALVNNEADILVSDTGSGKTIMLIETVCRTGKATCVIVNKQILMKQWLERFTEFTEGATIGLHYSKKKYNGEDVCITTVQTLLRTPYESNREFYDRFGVVIFDEVHRYGGFEFRKAIDNFPAKRRYGCTATVDRNDHFNVFKWSIGQRLHKVKNVDIAVPSIRIESTPYFSFQNHYQEYLEEISRNADRNALIIDKLREFCKDNRKTLVLSHRVEHVKRLYEMFVEVEPGMETASVVFVGETQKYVNITDEIQVIFATYQLIGEGIDFPTYDTEILTTPFGDRINSKQVPGRLSRKNEFKKTPLVLDLVDKDDRARRYYYKRKHHYTKNGYEIDDRTVVVDESIQNGVLNTD